MRGTDRRTLARGARGARFTGACVTQDSGARRPSGGASCSGTQTSQPAPLAGCGPPCPLAGAGDGVLALGLCGWVSGATTAREPCPAAGPASCGCCRTMSRPNPTIVGPACEIFSAAPPLTCTDQTQIWGPACETIGSGVPTPRYIVRFVPTKRSTTGSCAHAHDR